MASDSSSSAGEPIPHPRAILIYEYAGLIYCARGDALAMQWNRDVFEVPSPDEWKRLAAGRDLTITGTLRAKPGDIVTVEGTLDAWWARTGATGKPREYPKGELPG